MVQLRDAFRDANDLMAYYSQFSGQTLEEISGHIHECYPEIARSLRTNKGIVGQVLEGLVGRAPNSEKGQDLSEIGVELKVLPLRKSDRKLQPKERSKIKSINYSEISKQKWPTSDVRDKMKCIVFLAYEQPTGKSYKDWKTLVFKMPLLFNLNDTNETIVAEDWEYIRSTVSSGRAHELSESGSTILGASTSGTGKEIEYGGLRPAKQRSYSLKHSYMKHFYEEVRGTAEFQSIYIPSKIRVQDHLVELLSPKLEGRTLKDLAIQYGIDFSVNAKASFRYLVNKILDVDRDVLIKEIERAGIQIKTVPVNSEGMPWEAMSFPKFSLADLLYEEWNGEDGSGATFKAILDNPFIFIPVIKVKDGKLFEPWTKWQIGTVTLWEPTEGQLSGIKQEWEEAKGIVCEGVEVSHVKHGKGTRQVNNLPKQSENQFIHMRPHARDANDIDIPYAQHTKGKVRICWQSFWLNKDFIKALLKA